MDKGLKAVVRAARLPFKIGTAVNFFGETKKLGNYEPGIFPGPKSDKTRDSAYAKLLTQEFDLIEPGNELKMSGLWIGITRDASGSLVAQCDFSNLRRAAEYAVAHKLSLRGHLLVYNAWYQLPQSLFDIDWATQKVTLKPGFSPDDVRSALKSYVTQVVQETVAINSKARREHKLKALIPAWDVTNECVADSNSSGGPNGFRYPDSDLWYQSGPKGIGGDNGGYSYLAEIFRWASEALAGADRADRFALYYNDYNGEYSAEKWEAIKNVVRHVRTNGGRIDGMGFQTHLIATKDDLTRGQLAKAVRESIALGLRFSITEVDIRLRTPATDVSLEQQRLWQAKNYHDIAAVCRTHAKHCDLLQFWGFHDDGSWIPTTFSGWGEATPFYGWSTTAGTFPPKPAYQAILDGLRGR